MGVCSARLSFFSVLLVRVNGRDFPLVVIVSLHLGSGEVYVLIYVYVQIVGFFLFVCLF